MFQRRSSNSVSPPSTTPTLSYPHIPLPPLYLTQFPQNPTTKRLVGVVGYHVGLISYMTAQKSGKSEGRQFESGTGQYVFVSPEEGLRGGG
jgi:hypothetical protein